MISQRTVLSFSTTGIAGLLLVAGVLKTSSSYAFLHHFGVPYAMAVLELASRADTSVTIYGSRPSCSVEIDNGSFPMFVPANQIVTLPLRYRELGDTKVDFVNVDLFIESAENKLQLSTFRFPVSRTRSQPMPRVTP